MLSVKTFETTNRALFSGGFNQGIATTTAVLMKTSYAHDPTQVRLSDIVQDYFGFSSPVKNPQTYTTNSGQNTVFTGRDIYIDPGENNAMASGIMLVLTNGFVVSPNDELMLFVDFGQPTLWTNRLGLDITRGIYYISNTGVANA